MKYNQEQAVSLLNDNTVLTLYHGLENVSEEEAAKQGVTSETYNAITERAVNLLQTDAGASFYNTLDNASAKERTEAYSVAAKALQEEADVVDRDTTWRMNNYANYKSKFEENSKVLADELGLNQITLEQALTITSAVSTDNSWVTDYTTAIKDKVAKGELSDEAVNAFNEMTAIADEAEKYNYGTIDAYTPADNIATYKSIGTDGVATDLEGIGAYKYETDIANGIGEGIAGNGIGNDIGDGIGYISDSYDNSNTSNTSNNNGSLGGSTETNYTDTTVDDASNYAKLISNEPQINHIFNNSFYNEPPLPKWSFSVDFIPCYNNVDSTYSMFVDVDDLKVLTEAIIKINAAEKTVNTQSLFYLGMSHPFFTKMPQSHGDLNITFAEDEYYTVSTILAKLMRYASFATSFPTYEIPTTEDFINAKSEAIASSKASNTKNSLQTIMHAATDTESPAYRLNAAAIDVTSTEDFTKLAYRNKFLFDVVLKIYKPIDVHIFSDASHYPQYVYHYHNCWLKNIKGIELDYNSDEMINRDVTFSYQYMSSYDYAKYAEKYGLNIDTKNNTTTTANDNTVSTITNLQQDVEGYVQHTPASISQEAALQFEKQNSEIVKSDANVQGAAATAAAQAARSGASSYGRSR